MHVLGKVLAVFNVLMVILAFAYFLPVDWGTRKSWAHSYYRHELVLKGLPLNNEETDPDGRRLVDKMSENTKKQIFQGAGKDVATQMEEIKNVRSELEGKDEAQLKGILSNMARTGAERDEILGGKLGKSELITRIFEDVDKAEKEKNASALRAAIAHVLFNVYEKDEKEKRLPVIVGLKEYAREANQEADALLAMAARVRRAMQRDLASFEARYPQLIKDIQTLAEKIEDAKKQLEFQEQLWKSHNSLVTKRTQDVEALKKAIFDARLATRRAMDELAKEQKLYYQAEDEAGKRAKENQQLEREIRQKEHVGE
jgi:hypothetical protein